MQSVPVICVLVCLKVNVDVKSNHSKGWELPFYLPWQPDLLTCVMALALLQTPSIQK